MPKISVILPCYNVEKYIDRSLSSLEKQTLSNIEIICIDDKSTDNTLAIIKRHAKNDSRIRIIAQKQNVGAAVARNAGLDAATGEYIGFVDPDDYVDTDFYEKLYNVATQNNSDITKGNVICTDSNTGFTGDHWLNKYVHRDILYFSTTFWSAIYNHEFLKKNKIRFPDEIRTSQDSVFLTLVTLHTNKISVIDDTYYHYFYQRAGSLDSATLPHWKAESKLNAFKLNLEYIEKSNLDTKRKNIAIEQHCLRHALYESHKTFDNEIDIRNMFLYIANIAEMYPDTNNYIKKNVSRHEYRTIINRDFDRFKFYKYLQRTRLYLFNFIPFIKIDTIGSNQKYFIFDILPILRVFEKRKYYLFGIIPFLKIKG